MQYFVTGATGFIGKRLVKTLLARKGAIVHFLLRPESESKVAALLRILGRGQGACGAGVRRPDERQARRLGRRREEAQGRDRPHVPPGRGLRPLGRRGEPGQGQHRRHAQRGRVRQGHRRRAFPPCLEHRRRGPVRRRVPRGHVRRGRGPGPPLLHDQAREREDRAQGVQGAVDGVPPGDGGRRLDHRRDGQDRRPVLLLQADPAHAPDPAALDAQRSASKAGASTSCRSTSSSPRSTTSATTSTPAASATTWSTRWATASATCSTSSARPRTRRR